MNLTLLLQVSIDESPYNLWNGANMYEGDISDVLVLNGILPHVIVAQAFQLHTGLLDFASSEVLYSFRYVHVLLSGHLGRLGPVRVGRSKYLVVVVVAVEEEEVVIVIVVVAVVEV